MPKENWPTEENMCYDCGSTIPNHHTPLCALADDDDIKDLPQKEGTQWWIGWVNKFFKQGRKEDDV